MTMRAVRKTMLRAFVLASALALLVCCTSGGSGVTSSSSGSSGGAGGTPSQGFCYLSSNGRSCECVASNDDANRPAADWSKVTTCDGSAFTGNSGKAVCFADTKIDGTTTTCNCQPLGCRNRGGDYRFCSCGPISTDEGTETTECTGAEWYCGANDGTSCYAGNGSFGSACGNDENNVTSCKLADIKLTTDQRTTCAGLKFVAPPPSTSSSSSSSSGGCTGCSSDSDCHDKCKRCDRTTCSCVSRISC